MSIILKFEDLWLSGHCWSIFEMMLYSNEIIKVVIDDILSKQWNKYDKNDLAKVSFIKYQIVRKKH